MFDREGHDFRQDQAQVEAYERVRGWVRARFGLGQDSAILVAELKCGVPGCPPIETALAFWTEEDSRQQFKLLKPVAEIISADIAWLIGDLSDEETNYWDCC